LPDGKRKKVFSRGRGFFWEIVQDSSQKGGGRIRSRHTGQKIQTCGTATSTEKGEGRYRGRQPCEGKKINRCLTPERVSGCSSDTLGGREKRRRRGKRGVVKNTIPFDYGKETNLKVLMDAHLREEEE